MTGPHKRMIYFGMLCIAATTMAGVATYWLGKEQARLESQLERDTRIKAQALADRWVQAIEATQTAIMTDLRVRFVNGSMEDLFAYRDARPEIRNVFVWEPLKGATATLPGQQISLDETRFLQRFQGLFSTDSSFGRTRVADQAQVSATNVAFEVETFGWVVWYWEDQFSWLGWIMQPGMDTRVIGVELESFYVLSVALSRQELASKDQVLYRLIDQKGSVFHQTGMAQAGETPLLELPMGKALPGWTLQASMSGAVGLTSDLFVWSARIVLILLTLAVIFGAWVLQSQANREFRDARQKTNFVANVSHELKTPLTSICMYAEMLQSGRVEDEGKKKHYLDVIVQQTQRLTRLVNNVLSFGRLEQGRERFHLRALNLKDVTAGILTTQLPRIKEAGATLEMTLASVVAIVDEDAFSQVLLNLLDNALKYGVDAEGRCRVEVELTDTGKMAVLRLSDFGPGVPPSLQKAIFDKFFRGDDSLTRKRDGSGIGLSIAKLLIEGMGGTLGYQAQQGYGASFVVALPKDFQKSEV